MTRTLFEILLIIADPHAMTTGECCYVCNECPNSFATLPELEQHLSEGHNGLKTELLEKMSVDEGIDQDHGVNSPSSSDSTSDDSVDMEEKPSVYNCRFCPKVFEDRSQLNVHYTHTHRDKPQYVCETCGIVFGVKRELSTHMRIHSGEQPHKCTQCGKEFGTRQLLKKHWMWHTGERSHVCPHCDKAFFQKGHLTQHLMIHAGGRPHRCQLCHKTFIFKFDLNRHMKIHAERGHLCSKCGRSFLKQASLEEHALKCKGSPALARSRSSTRTSTPLMTTSDSALTPASESSAVPSPKTTTPVPSAPVPQLNMLNFASPNAHQLPANINSDDVAKLAFFLQQQRALATLTAQNLANSQLLKGQTPFPSLTPVSNGSNNFYCIFCQKNFTSQVNLQLHLNFQHMKNGVFTPHPVEEQTMNYQSNIFGLPLAGLKTEEPGHTHSESATNSSCASSPIKGSPMDNHSPTNTVSDVDQLSGRSESPESVKPCDQCNVYARRNLELEAENSRMHSTLEQQKNIMPGAHFL
uniref:Protein krueppel n=1 Tax=Steinernema glaseri TaxID=37863 RepID=A0A1I8AAV7_9BILA